MNKKSKKDILGISTLSHKFQVTIPKEVREVTNLSEGDKIVFVNEDDRIYLKLSTEI